MLNCSLVDRFLATTNRGSILIGKICKSNIASVRDTMITWLSANSRRIMEIQFYAIARAVIVLFKTQVLVLNVARGVSTDPSVLTF